MAFCPLLVKVSTHKSKEQDLEILLNVHENFPVSAFGFLRLRLLNSLSIPILDHIQSLLCLILPTYLVPDTSWSW